MNATEARRHGKLPSILEYSNMSHHFSFPELISVVQSLCLKEAPMADTEGEKIRATLITHMTNILRKYPDVTSDQLTIIFDEVCQYLIKKGRLKHQKGK